MFGRDGRNVIPVRVDREGRLLTVPIRRWPSGHRPHVKCCFRFEENSTDVVTDDAFAALSLEDISHSLQYVYAVHNLGHEESEVRIQVGPSPESLADDLDGIITIPACETKIITPLLFSKYMRLLYRSAHACHPTRLRITFQAQVKRS